MKSKKSNIAYFSSNRSDFGIVNNLLNIIEKSKNFNLHIVISGNHFIKKFGYTYKEIISEKYKNIYKLQLSEKDLSSPHHKISKIHNFFQNKKIQLLVVLGDRYETLLCASIAHFLNIPIIHIHGGEKTSGSKDDNYRHAISKLSTIHFVMHQDYKKRLIQLGENKKNIFCFSPLAYENINLKLNKTNKFNDSEKKFLMISKKLILIAFHPSSQSREYDGDDFRKLLKILSKIENVKILITAPNPDPGYKIIHELTVDFIKKNKFAIFIPNLGQVKYFNILKYTDLFIGNSSSGVIEVPYFGIPILNIGDRQRGRITSKNVFNVKIINNDLIKIIKKSLKFKKLMTKSYLSSFPSKKMFQIINKLDLTKISILKNFKDI